VDLASLIDEVYKSFEPLARERGLQLRRKTPPPPVDTLIDRDKILQVFTNLINNALKFTSQGHVEISAEVQDRQIQCRVADTGPGIDPRNLPKVFSKFAQFSTAPAGREKGTGLGLSLCKGFVELHGGRIWVESRLHEGTQFLFVLPRLQGQELFIDHSKRLLETMVAKGKPLSLLRIGFPQWDDVENAVGPQSSLALWNQFVSRMTGLVGVESDNVFQDRAVLWFALPEVDRQTAQDIIQRIQTQWHDRRSSDPAAMANPPVLEIRRATFPEDGQAIEQLCGPLDLKAA